VSETDLERIFAPLDRRASPCDAQQERMGVGLSIARTFARAQRGDVRYRARGRWFGLRVRRCYRARQRRDVTQVANRWRC